MIWYKINTRASYNCNALGTICNSFLYGILYIVYGIWYGIWYMICTHALGTICNSLYMVYDIHTHVIQLQCIAGFVIVCLYHLKRDLIISLDIQCIVSAWKDKSTMLVHPFFCFWYICLLPSHPASTHLVELVVRPSSTWQEVWWHCMTWHAPTFWQVITLYFAFVSTSQVLGLLRSWKLVVN